MVKARDRAIIDHECEAAARRQAERDGKRGADRSAVKHGDDVAPAVFPGSGARSRRRRVRSDRQNSRRWAGVRPPPNTRRNPAPGSGSSKTRAGRGPASRRDAAPRDPGPEKIPAPVRGRRRRESPARSGGTREMTGDPDRAARQQCRQPGKHGGVAAVAGQVALTVDAALVDDHRRVADKPPARSHGIRLPRLWSLQSGRELWPPSKPSPWFDPAHLLEAPGVAFKPAFRRETATFSGAKGCF